MGLGIDGNDSKILKSSQEDLAAITGQKPIITKFKKSISNFKTRKNTNAGLKVTLRKDKMYEFIDRLVNIALPRIKDFRGLSPNGFDMFGNPQYRVNPRGRSSVIDDDGALRFRARKARPPRFKTSPAMRRGMTGQQLGFSRILDRGMLRVGGRKLAKRLILNIAD